MLNRLGGDIGMPNGQTVRIAFGKADSAPLVPGPSRGAGGSSSSSADSPPGPPYAQRYDMNYFTAGSLCMRCIYSRYETL